MVLDLQYTQVTELDGLSIVLGKEGPTTHLIQVESYFDPTSGIEQFYLTDVDFILKGNSYFRDSLTN